MKRAAMTLLLAALTGGCQMNGRDQVLQTANTEAAQRAISTRVFDADDRQAVFEAAPAALQDLQFVIDRADPSLRTVSATRYGGGLAPITITVRKGGGKSTIVRASGQVNQSGIAEAEAFQRVFDALGRSPFLQPHEI